MTITQLIRLLGEFDGDVEVLINRPGATAEPLERIYTVRSVTFAPDGTQTRDNGPTAVHLCNKGK